MLGRLHMSLAQCKKAYLELAGAAFTPKNRFMQVVEKVNVGPQYKSKPLEDAIKSTIAKAKDHVKTDPENALLKEDNCSCKV